jgi:hypothetical protein
MFTLISVLFDLSLVASLGLLLTCLLRRRMIKASARRDAATGAQAEMSS